MRRSIIGLLVVVVGGALLALVVPWVLPHLGFIPQTVYRHRVDERHEFRVFTKYSEVAGVMVYCQALRDGRPLTNPTWLCRWNKKPLTELRFQTVVADAMAAFVSEDHPFYILILVDLRTAETSRRTDDESWPDERHQKRG